MVALRPVLRLSYRQRCCGQMSSVKVAPNPRTECMRVSLTAFFEVCRSRFWIRLYAEFLPKKSANMHRRNGSFVPLIDRLLAVFKSSPYDDAYTQFFSWVSNCRPTEVDGYSMHLIDSMYNYLSKSSDPSIKRTFSREMLYVFVIIVAISVIELLLHDEVNLDAFLDFQRLNMDSQTFLRREDNPMFATPVGNIVWNFARAIAEHDRYRRYMMTKASPKEAKALSKLLIAAMKEVGEFVDKSMLKNLRSSAAIYGLGVQQLLLEDQCVTGASLAGVAELVQSAMGSNLIPSSGVVELTTAGPIISANGFIVVCKTKVLPGMDDENVAIPEATETMLRFIYQITWTLLRLVNEESQKSSCCSCTPWG